MKKLLLGAILGVLYWGNVWAESCSEGYYWNSIDKRCEQCFCPTCTEYLYTYYTGSILSRYDCTSCYPGEYLERTVDHRNGNGNSCEPCSDLTIPNGTCVACVSDEGELRPGYILGGICTDVVCNDGYILSDSGCVKNECPENCASCDSEGLCSECDYGYTLSNGACVKTPTCSAGQYPASDGTCQPCSNISVPNGSCLSCSSSSQCDNISCNTGYVKKGLTCVKAATCTYPLKEVADYSGECAGCCTD